MSRRSKKNSPASSGIAVAEWVAPALVPAAPPAPPPADELFWEHRVAVELGIARERLRALREQHLTLDHHFIMRRGAVVLTASGLARINELLAVGTLPPPAPQNPATATAQETASAVPSGPPLRAKFIVAMVPLNKRLLVCRREAGAPTSQIVRVKDNSNFLPKMTVPVIAAGHGWQVYGRLPRRKGRW